jgi:hypothetical protein
MNMIHAGVESYGNRTLYPPRYSDKLTLITKEHCCQSNSVLPRLDFRKPEDGMVATRSAICANEYFIFC